MDRQYMTRKKTIWGFFLNKINKQHELILDQTYADLLDCLAACVVASDFTRFHNYLKELNYSSDFTFVSELAEKNSEYAHIDYLRKHFFIESFALLGDFAGLLNAQRTLAKKGSRHIAAHYGLYRRLVPDIVATGLEIYYCVGKSWLISTKRKEIKAMVLDKFSAAVVERSKRDRCSFFEEFASRHEAAIRTSLQDTGFGSLHLQCLLEKDKQLLLKMAESVPSAYENYIKKNDWHWIVSKFSSEKNAIDVLETNVIQLKDAMLPHGRLFLNFMPNYSLFYEVWQQPKMLKRAKDGPTDLYPKCCKDIAYLPFGTIGYWPPAGGIYMVALIHAATQWLEEFSKPWKGGK
jgi:hypothetical protein